MGRAAIPTPPAWYPQDFDLLKLARAAKAELTRLGYGVHRPEETRQLVFTDADHTFLQTHAPVFVRHKQSGERLLDPSTLKPFAIALKTADYEADYARLRRDHPNVAWHDYTLDFTWYHSVEEIQRTKGIAPTLHALRAVARDELSRTFVITARSSEDVVHGLDQYLDKRGVDVAGVFAVNSPEKMRALGLDAPSLDSAKRKALVMAGLIHLHSQSGRAPERVVFYDDADANLVAAMQLLPKLFPKTSFEFHDVQHRGNGRFVPTVVAVSSGVPGGLMRKNGAPLSEGDITGHRSSDAEFAVPSLDRYRR